MIGKAKRRIRITMMCTTLFWCALLTLVMWGLLVRFNATDKITQVLLVSLCVTAVSEVITLIVSLVKCHAFTKRLYMEENSALIDADQFHKIDSHYSLGNSWLTYHKGIHYYVFSKENNTFEFDRKHVYVIKDNKATCLKANQKEIQMIKEWSN